MKIGMLWFDNDPKTGLEIKIERAATYYRNKYGKNPTLCFVHPSMLPEAAGAGHPASATHSASANPMLQSVAAGPGGQEKTALAAEGGPAASFKSGGIEVHSTRTVLPNHFWIGTKA